MSSLGLVLAGVVLSGCAGAQRADMRRSDTAGLASPGPALVGTWRGLAMNPEYGGPVDTDVELTIRADGTWQWGKGGGDVQARGYVARADDRVVLEAEQAKDLEQRIQLQRTGDTLWGVSHAFIPGRTTTVRLDKVER
jgi:hypothetical protein